MRTKHSGLAPIPRAQRWEVPKAAMTVRADEQHEGGSTKNDPTRASADKRPAPTVCATNPGESESRSLSITAVSRSITESRAGFHQASRSIRSQRVG